MYCQSSFSCHLGVDWIQHESNCLLRVDESGRCCHTNRCGSESTSETRIPTACFVPFLNEPQVCTSFPHEHQNTSQATKADSFFSHGEWRDVSFTELPTWQYVFQLSKSCSCGPKPPLKRRDVHWCVPYLFFVHAKRFSSTIVSVHLGRALPVHDMK